MKRKDLEFLIESFLHKVEEKSLFPIQYSNIPEIILKTFLNWCVSENLLEE